MNLIEYLNQDLHQNSLDVLLGLSPSLSSVSSQSEPQYDFGSGTQNCETYKWIWEDDNSSLDTSSKEQDKQDKQIIDMKNARTDQQSRVKQYMSWISQMTPHHNINQIIKTKRRIKKINKKRR